MASSLSKRSGFVLWNLLSAVILLLLLELAVRIFIPRIQPAGTDSNLFRNSADGSLRLLNPGQSGLSNGEYHTVSPLGFWDYGVAYDPERKSVLLFGDSVGMGIGVDPDSTVGGRLLMAFPEYNILNTSLIGYSSADYANLAQSWQDGSIQEWPDTTITSAVVIWCLNDIYGRSEISNLPGLDPPGLLASMLSWLRSNTRLYHFIKSIATDRSRDYYRFDASFYQPDSDYVSAAVADLDHLRDTLANHEIELLVVLIPYEYQLRNRDYSQNPLQILADRLSAEHINSINLTSDFQVAYETAGKDLYLYADGLHLSHQGHKVLSAGIQDVLERGSDAPR